MSSNRNWRVVILLTVCFVIYLVFSVIMYVFDINYKPLQNINLISEVINPEKVRDSQKPDETYKNIAKGKEVTRDFELYKKPGFITDFSSGDRAVALQHFTEKLYELQKTKKGKIRIAYFGDSMIEGDLLTRKLRKLFQAEFGGAGVGFLPFQSKVAPYRESSEIKSTGWNVVNFMDKNVRNMYISGFSFSGSGSTNFVDKTLKPGTTTNKFVIFGKGAETNLSYNNTLLMLNGGNSVNIQPMSKDTLRAFTVKTQNTNVPQYGISIESDNGVIIDNFSFRGITGVEFKKIDEDFLKAVQEKNHYDLIVMQYGVNLLFRPNDTDYSYYVKLMTPNLVKFKKAFSDANILLVSTADRAFRYNGEFQSAKGVKNLVETQAKMAYDNQLSFFNLFQSMGGENSIVSWASQDPPLANKDYVHPNGKGTDILAEKIYQAMMKDYKNFVSTKKNKK